MKQYSEFHAEDSNNDACFMFNSKRTNLIVIMWKIKIVRRRWFDFEDSYFTFSIKNMIEQLIHYVKYF